MKGEHDASAERRYHETARVLQGLSLERLSNSALAKKALPVLEELLLLDRFARPALVTALRNLSSCEKKEVQELLPVLMWRCVVSPQKDQVYAGTTFEAVVKSTTAACFGTDMPEARRTHLLCLLMHSLLQHTSENLVFDIPNAFLTTLMDALRSSIDGKTSEKRGFATKAAWHEGKRARLMAHLSALTLANKLLITHLFPCMSMEKSAKNTLHGFAELLTQTALEYSYKTKDVPVVRECLSCLIQLADLSPETVMACVGPHLPTDMSQVLAQEPVRKDKEKKVRVKAILPCWDPLAASSLAKLCLAVLHKQSNAAAVKSPFMNCLNLLFHHSHHLVFADSVFGIVKRHGLYHLLLQPDVVYGSKERLIEYTIDRVQSMLKAGQVTCSTGLRVASALCEQHLVNASTSKVLLLHPSVTAALERFHNNPFLSPLCIKAVIWLTAVDLSQDDTDEHSVGKPAKVRGLLQMLMSMTSNALVQSEQTPEFLRTLLRALKLLPPSGSRGLLTPAFTGIVEYLQHRCPKKLALHGFYALLREFLLSVDVVHTPAASVPSTGKGPLDIDRVPHQRHNGGTQTLHLVLNMLDGTVSPEVAAVEKLLPGQSDSEAPSADVLAKSSKLLVEVIRFTGDFGNLMALMCSQPHHIVWEAGIAMLKLCARSHPVVRVKVYTILCGVVRLRSDMQSMLQPLITVTDLTLQLQETLQFAQRASDDADSLVDVNQLAARFYTEHEALKQHLAVYVKFAEFKNIKLLGTVAEELLAKGSEFVKKNPNAVTAAVPVVPPSAPAAAAPAAQDDIDLLFG